MREFTHLILTGTICIVKLIITWDALSPAKAKISDFPRQKMVRGIGLEPMTPSASRRCSSSELTAHFCWGITLIRPQI